MNIKQRTRAGRAAATAFAVGLAQWISANAQSTLALSNLEMGVSRTEPVASDAWVAAGFRVGVNPGGYRLDSVELGIGGVTGSPGDQNVAVYEFFSSSSSPALKLGDLSASGSDGSGSYYFDGGGLVLGDGLYQLVATSESETSVGSYLWNVSSSSTFSAEEGWDMRTAYLVSENGLDWRLGDRSSRMQYAINATAIPEPSTLALFGCGALFAAIRLRRAKRRCAE